MKILIHSFAFFPGHGGIETTSARLAEYWLGQGHEVTLITWTKETSGVMKNPANALSEGKVFRRPSLLKQFQLAYQADIVWQNHISLRLLFPPLLIGRRTIVTIQTWLAGQENLETPLSFIKRLALCLVRPIAISNAVRNHLKSKEVPVIYNPVAIGSDAVHRRCEQRGDFLFVGRLVSDKGADLLISAFTGLLSRKPNMRLTIVGDGPERSNLEQLAEPLGNAVMFTGNLSPHAVELQMRSHNVLVVPSRWQEPLGIVALEGLNAGCQVIASKGGGLAELERFGVRLFTHNNVESLQEQMLEAINHPKESHSKAAFEKRFSTTAVGEAYLKLFKS